MPRLLVDLKLPDTMSKTLSDFLPTVMDQMRAGNKIQAIVILRGVVPCSLLAAKLAVEGPIQECLGSFSRAPKLRVIRGGG